MKTLLRTGVWVIQRRGFNIEIAAAPLFRGSLNRVELEAKR